MGNGHRASMLSELVTLQHLYVFSAQKLSRLVLLSIYGRFITEL